MAVSNPSLGCVPSEISFLLPARTQSRAAPLPTAGTAMMISKLYQEAAASLSAIACFCSLVGAKSELLFNLLTEVDTELNAYCDGSVFQLQN